MLSRRALLLGGAAVVVGGAAGGVAAVEEDLLPGRMRLDRALGRCRVDAAVPRDVRAPSFEGTFTSVARGRTVGWSIAVSPGVAVDTLPVVIVLHGRGDTARGLRDVVHLDAHLAAGRPPLALVAADGGEAYWHPRVSGDDPLRMLTTELLPALRAARFPLRDGPVGVLGWSMGGYGALLLARESAAGRLGGLRVAAAAASSPALFPSYAAAAPGAFDDAADWSRWGDLVPDAPAIAAAVPLRVDCGSTDAFAGEARRLREAARPEPAGTVGRGCHDSAYWSSVAAGQLDFLATRLQAAGP